jgi:hypothetical protein
LNKQNLCKKNHRSWIDRQLAAKASVTQVLQQTATQLVVKIVNAKVMTKTDGKN